MYSVPVLNRHTAHRNFNSIIPNNTKFDFGSDMAQLCLDDRTNQDIFFPVASVPLSEMLSGNFTDTEERQAIIDCSDNNRIIAVHGKQYNLVKNTTAFDMVNDAINELGVRGVLNVDGMHIKDACVQKGGKAIRQYIFPNHSVNIEGSDVLMRIVVINSYDGSANFSLQVGGFRIVCLNGMVVGNKFLNLTKKHSASLNLGIIEERLCTTVTAFESAVTQWKLMSKTAISNAEADRLFGQFAIVNGKTSIDRFNMMMELFDSHKKDLGANWWAAYNTLTAWSTHSEVQQRNIVNRENVILKREGEVSALMRNRKIWMPK